MKYLLLGLMFLSVSVSAQEAKLDITPFLNKLSACSAVTHKGDLLAGGCFSPLTWTWGSANIGVTWDTNDSGDQVRSSKGVGGAIMALGIRADKAWAWGWRKLDMEKKGFEVHFVVPKIEFGPMGGYNHRLGWITGGFLSGKWKF